MVLCMPVSRRSYSQLASSALSRLHLTSVDRKVWILWVACGFSVPCLLTAIHTSPPHPHPHIHPPPALGSHPNTTHEHMNLTQVISISHQRLTLRNKCSRLLTLCVCVCVAQRRKTAAKDAYKLTLRCLSTFDGAPAEVSTTLCFYLSSLPFIFWHAPLPLPCRTCLLHFVQCSC